MSRPRSFGLVLGGLMACIVVGLGATEPSSLICQDYFVCYDVTYQDCADLQRECTAMCRDLGGVSDFICPGENCVPGGSGLQCFAECSCYNECPNPVTGDCPV